MTFNLQKYLIENNLTLKGIIRLQEEDAAALAQDNSTSSNTSSDKDTKDLEKNKKQLEQLQAKAKDIIFKYTEDTPTGRKVKGSISNYKKAIGDIPNKIKQLKNKIDAIEDPKTDDTTEQD